MEDAEIEWLTDKIVKAFESRVMPERPIEHDTVQGDELPPGHPGFGLGEPIPCSDTDFIYRKIWGKRWQDIDPLVFQWTWYYLTIEAIAYYLPAILIHNINILYRSEDTSLYLRRDDPDRIVDIDAYLGKDRYNVFKGYMERLYHCLSHDQRIAVAEYVGFNQQEFTEADMLFWKGGNSKSNAEA